MRVLLDTNILLRLADSTHRGHAVAVNAVDSLVASGEEVFVVSQNLQEFWVVATKSVPSNGLGKSTRYALKWVTQFADVFTLLKVSAQLYETWLALVDQYDIKGTNAHDARLAAAVLTHELTHLLTFNASDFRRYLQVSVIALELPGTTSS